MRNHERITVSAAAFDNGYADLKHGPVPNLDALIKKYMNTTHFFEIAGYTADDKSDDIYNNEMSLRRAESVRNYLQRKGIEATRMMDTVGRGASAPVSTNTTAAGRELNRRVEVTVIPA